MTGSNTPTPCRVVIADDTLSLRMMLRLAFQRDGGFELVGEAESGPEAVELTREAQPHVLVLDLNMPGSNGLDVLPELLYHAPRTRVLVLSGHDDEALRDEALDRGADRYLVKGAPLREVLAAIRELAAR